MFIQSFCIQEHITICSRRSNYTHEKVSTTDAKFSFDIILKAASPTTTTSSCLQYRKKRKFCIFVDFICIDSQMCIFELFLYMGLPQNEVYSSEKYTFLVES